MSSLEQMHAYLDAVWLQGTSHVKALEQVGATASDLLLWRDGEQYKTAYQERLKLVRALMLERAAIELASSLRRKAGADELDGHALVQGIGRLVEILGWDQQGEQQAAVSSTGIPFLKGVFAGVLESEKRKPAARKAVSSVKKDGTKKGKGGKGGGKC